MLEISLAHFVRCSLWYSSVLFLLYNLAIIVRLYNDLTIKSNENGLIRTRSCIQHKNRFLIRFASIRIAWTSKWTIILKKVSQYNSNDSLNYRNLAWAISICGIKKLKTLLTTKLVIFATDYAVTKLNTPFLFTTSQIVLILRRTISTTNSNYMKEQE